MCAIVRAMDSTAVRRRSFALWLAAGAAGRGRVFAAEDRPPLADMHSHATMFRRSADGGDLPQEMADAGVMLLAWAIVDDSPFLRASQYGLNQVREPAPGELWQYFQRRVAQCDERLRTWGLPKALTPADVDAAVAGHAHVVMASEAANFLEGRPERVAQAHASGLRHLQMVHFIASPLGDLQTEAPRHNGMPPVALQVIQECKRLGVLVDLAHSPPSFVDAALAGSDATMIWSHSWISARGGTWRDWQNVARSLSPAQAKRIVAHGGVVGLWTVRVRSDRSYPLRDAASYADEISRMADLLGPQGVAFGTDMEGAGSDPVMSRYAELREVADRLQRRGMKPADLQDVCIGNYARVLKKAMST
jgi:membrane dipeptidase